LFICCAVVACASPGINSGRSGLQARDLIFVALRS
jgi:hypothetical protein